MRVPLVIAALAACSSAGHMGARHAALAHRAQFIHNVPRDSVPSINAEALYVPLNVVKWRTDSIIEARDTAQFANIDPTDRAQMVFGQLVGEGELNIANMILYAANGLPIVMMEAFDSLTSAVDCQGDDGQISLTFSSPDAFNYALGSWSYIRENSTLQFLMITNHQGCGPDDQRQAYRITDIDNDEAHNIVNLKAVTAKWSEVASNFDMEFGKATVPPPTMKALRARGISLPGIIDKIKHGVGDAIDKAKAGAGDVIDDIKGGAGNLIDKAKDDTDKVVDKIEQGAGRVITTVKGTADNVAKGIADLGDIDSSKSITIPLSLGKENETVPLFEEFAKSPPRLKLSCASCFVDAKFETTGSLKVQNFKPESLRLEVSPKDFRAAIELTAEVAQTNPNLDFLKFEKALFETAIPGAGIVIPNLFTLGAKAALNVQASAGITGKATFTFGARTSLPNDGSKVVIDLVYPEDSSISGFKNAQVQPVFDMDQASVTVNVVAGPQVALTFGIDILENQGIEAGLTFGTPTVNLNITAGFNQDGFCGPDDPITSGIQTASAANFDIVLSVDAKLSETDTNPLFTRELVNIPIATFLDKCVSIPGITPAKQDDAGEALPSGTATVFPTGSAAAAKMRFRRI